MPDPPDMRAAGDWTEEKIDSVTAWTLVRTYHVVARKMAAICATVELGPTQFGVLAHLAASPRITQAELARRIFVTPQSMGDLVATLIQRGLVTKDGPGGRGRPARIELTEEGRNALERLTEPIVRFSSAESLGVTNEQAEVLNGLLHAVRSTLSD